MTSATNIHTDFLGISRQLLLEMYWPRLRSCVESLSVDQVWWRPNEASNSIGNLLLHLDGNARQWLVTSFKHSEDARYRPGEFSERRLIPVSELLAKLDATLTEAAEVIASLTEADLLRTYEIQGRTVTGLHAVYQVVEHFGIHYGQIVYVTKLLRAEDLGFYRELDKTGRFPSVIK
jgi:hypothetical protein